MFSFSTRQTRTSHKHLTRRCCPSTNFVNESSTGNFQINPSLLQRFQLQELDSFFPACSLENFNIVKNISKCFRHFKKTFLFDTFMTNNPPCCPQYLGVLFIISPQYIMWFNFLHCNNNAIIILNKHICMAFASVIKRDGPPPKY